MKTFFKYSATFLLLAGIAFAAYIWWLLQPRPMPQPMPAELLAITTSEGSALLAAADHTADHAALHATWESQELVSFCGVASGVTVVNALGGSVAQGDFFTPEASRVRSRMQVTFGGMSLPDLAGLLSAHGLDVELVHARESSTEAFRTALEQNLSTPGDYLLVNYQREVLGQGRVGHISPVSAYDSASDRVLILDTASYKYPYTWVPVPMLFEAMLQVDPATGKSRGYLAVN